MTNYLSARSIAILGEGQANRYDYWGAAKSFPGLTPIKENSAEKILKAGNGVLVSGEWLGTVRVNVVDGAE